MTRDEMLDQATAMAMRCGNFWFNVLADAVSSRTYAAVNRASRYMPPGTAPYSTLIQFQRMRRGLAVLGPRQLVNVFTALTAARLKE